jgi:NAD(P)H dehydrogenase (quinone)
MLGTVDHTGRMGEFLGSANDGLRFLVIHCHPDDQSFSRALCDAAVDGLGAAGHHVDVIDLYAEGFNATMSLDEWQAYESAAPIRDPLVQGHADLVKQAEGLVFVYPTWWWGMPALLKGWMERIFVKGVSFDLDPQTNRVVPLLNGVSRIVGISTYGSSRLAMLVFNDGGRRLLARCVRVLCPLRTTRTTWLGLYGMDHRSSSDREVFLNRVRSTMSSL